MWFKRKTKQEKEQELQAKLTHLKTKYGDEINSVCMLNNWIFILYGFTIVDNKIIVQYADENTMPGYKVIMDIDLFEMTFGSTDFIKARHNFVEFKHKLNNLGLKLEKI
jgi:hypothetical protein